jgi:hypothetical protein
VAARIEIVTERQRDHDPGQRAGDVRAALQQRRHPAAVAHRQPRRRDREHHRDDGRDRAEAQRRAGGLQQPVRVDAGRAAGQQPAHDRPDRHPEREHDERGQPGQHRPPRRTERRPGDRPGRAAADPGVPGPAAQAEVGSSSARQSSTSTPASMVAAELLNDDWNWS